MLPLCRAESGDFGKTAGEERLAYNVSALETLATISLRDSYRDITGLTRHMRVLAFSCDLALGSICAIGNLQFAVCRMQPSVLPDVTLTGGTRGSRVGD